MWVGFWIMLPERAEFVIPTGASQTTRLCLSMMSKVGLPFTSQLQATAAHQGEVILI